MLRRFKEGKKEKCDRCEFKASHSDEVLEHIQSVHKLENDKCDECLTEFSINCDFKKHIQEVHRGKNNRI